MFAKVVLADWVDPYIHRNVSSQRDLLYIDFPAYVHQYEPVSVTVYVNDPVLKEEANVVEVGPDNGNFYSVGRRLERDTGGYLRTFLPYNGESSFTVGFKTSSWVTRKEDASKPHVYFAFYSVKKPSGNSIDASLSDYQCSTYHNKYFCPNGPCEVCVKHLAVVWKEYWILPSHAEATLPSGFNWVDMRDEYSKKTAGSLYYSYSEKNKPIGQNDKSGKPITCDESYTLLLDVNYYGVEADMDYLRSWQLSYNKAGIAEGRVTVKDVSGPGGLLSGPAIEVIDKSLGEGQWDYYSVNYHLIAKMDPPESGTAKLEMSRKGCAVKGGGQAKIDEALRGVKQFGASYRVIYEGTEGGFTPKHWYDIRRRGDVKAVSGRITDGFGHGLPYISVSVEYEGNVFSGVADADGNYEIKIPSLDFSDENPKTGTLRIQLSYVRDGKNYFNVLDHLVGDKIVVVEKNFSLETEMDKTQDFDFATKSFTDISSSSFLNNLKHIGPIYYHMSEVTDFALSELKADIDYKLPVDVYFASNLGTSYSRDTSTIHINIDDSAYGSINRPDNREYHEFCHHILFSQWNGSGLRGPGDTNHGGYINNGTGDSYTEGFAEFCAMVCSKYRGEKRPEIYAGFGSMELNYKAWEHRGYDEELAVNGILWDLFDDVNDANDSISLPLDKMWSILKVKRPNFYEYYKAFQAAFPDKAEKIDKVFIDHGFFADKDKGNGVRDNFEPFRDANGDKVYQVGEFFVDYGAENMSYDVGEIVGKATNYERVDRGSIVKLPGSYIKAANPDVKTYKVKVHLIDPVYGEDFEYNVKAENGLVYVAPLPRDVDAEITVAPDTVEYVGEKPYVMSNHQFIERFFSAPEDLGYFDSHDFEVKSTGLRDDLVAVVDSEAIGEEVIEEGEDGGLGVSAPLWLVGGGVLLVGGGMFLVALLLIVFLLIRKKRN